MDQLTLLLVGTAQGDRGAFQHLYRATSAKLLGIIARIIVDSAEAEDILQDAYVRIWNNAWRYDAALGRPMTWLITIARRGAIDRLRKHSRQKLVDLERAGEIVDPMPTADVVLFASREIRQMNAALDRLPAHVVAAIQSIYFEGLSYDQLATRDGIPCGTIKSWVRRGLIRVRAELTLQQAA